MRAWNQSITPKSEKTDTRSSDTINTNTLSTYRHRRWKTNDNEAVSPSTSKNPNQFHNHAANVNMTQSKQSNGAKNDITTQLKHANTESNTKPITI